MIIILYKIWWQRTRIISKPADNQPLKRAERIKKLVFINFNNLVVSRVDLMVYYFTTRTQNRNSDVIIFWFRSFFSSLSFRLPTLSLSLSDYRHHRRRWKLLQYIIILVDNIRYTRGKTIFFFFTDRFSRENHQKCPRSHRVFIRTAAIFFYRNNNIMTLLGQSQKVFHSTILF